MSNFGNPGLGFPYSYRQQLLNNKFGLGINRFGIIIIIEDGTSLNAEQQVLLPQGSSDFFSVGDPVFYDYFSGTPYNFNKMLPSLALTSGPASSNAIGNSKGTIPIFLEDNSYVIFTILSSSLAISATKYSPSGSVLSTNVIIETPSGISGVAKLANGNFVVVFSCRDGYNQAGWVIISPTLNVLYESSLSSNDNWATSYLHPLAGGGFLIFRGVVAGIITNVSATGASTDIYAPGFASFILGKQSEYVFNKNILSEPASSNKVWQQFPGCVFSISDGGYGFFVAADDINLQYVRVHADGSLNAITTVFDSGTGLLTSDINISYDPISGHIAWATSQHIHYGIIDDDGTIVLAATAITDITATPGNVYSDVIHDGIGSFLFIFTGDNTNRVIYTDSAGTPKTGYPRVLVAHNARVFGLHRLSTGIAVITLDMPNITTLCRFQFITTSGAFRASKNFGTDYEIMNSIVINDQLIGVLAGPNNSNGYKLYNYSSIGTLLINKLVDNTLNNDIGTLKLFEDSSRSAFWVVGDRTIGTYFGLHNIEDLALIQSYNSTASSSMLDMSLILKDHIFVTFDVSDEGVAAGNLYFIKPRATVLLGVADQITPAYQLLKVDTKGLLPTTWFYSGVFDQSSNTPPGNKGWFGNALVKLEGF